MSSSLNDIYLPATNLSPRYGSLQSQSLRSVTNRPLVNSLDNTNLGRVSEVNLVEEVPRSASVRSALRSNFHTKTPVVSNVQPEPEEDCGCGANLEVSAVQAKPQTVNLDILIGEDPQSVNLELKDPLKVAQSPNVYAKLQEAGFQVLDRICIREDKGVSCRYLQVIDKLGYKFFIDLDMAGHVPGGDSCLYEACKEALTIPHSVKSGVAKCVKDNVGMVAVLFDDNMVVIEVAESDDLAPKESYFCRAGSQQSLAKKLIGEDHHKKKHRKKHHDDLDLAVNLTEQSYSYSPVIKYSKLMANCYFAAREIECAYRRIHHDIAIINESLLRSFGETVKHVNKYHHYITNEYCEIENKLKKRIKKYRSYHHKYEKEYFDNCGKCSDPELHDKVKDKLREFHHKKDLLKDVMAKFYQLNLKMQETKLELAQIAEELCGKSKH